MVQPAVHPRACGEHPLALARLLTSRGSSPRLRGTCVDKARLNANVRFIPAPAGNIRQGLALSRSYPVHPRACGEHFTMSERKAVSAGSSPRLRGTFAPDEFLDRIARFIPAPAGNMD